MAASDTTHGVRARRAGILSALAWLLLFATALLMRSLRFGLIFGKGMVPFPHGADEFYHLRRIWFAVVNFPASLDFDLYLNHPVGAPPHWPPLFDWTLAAVARGLVGADDQRAVEAVVAWAPPVLGALGVLAAAWLARRTFSRAAGWATGAILAVLPAHVELSSLGVIDHHVAVGLTATLLLAAAMQFAGSAAAAPRSRSAATVGVLFSATILLWTGALLHVLIVQLFLVAQLLVTGERTTAVGRARSLAGAHALAGLLLLPFCVGNDWPDFGPLSPWVLSNFQPLWFASGALCLALVSWLWSAGRYGAKRSWRAASAVGLAALGLGAAFLLAPGLRDAVREAASFFEPSPFLQVVAEMSPLLAPDGAFDPSLAHYSFSYLFWAYPAATVGLATWAITRRRADVLLLLFASFAFAVMTLRQQRFTDVSSAGFALVVVPAALMGFHALRRRVKAPSALWAIAALLLCVAALLPYAPLYPSIVTASRAALRGDPQLHTADVRRAAVMQRVARWMRQETSPTRGYLRATEPPEYGVLAPWGHGHRLRYYAERPMVQDNFALWGGMAGFEAAGRYFDSASEQRGIRIAERLSVRYVVATPFGSGQHLPRPGSLAQRLALAPGRGGALSFPKAAPPLAQHRLLYATDDRDLARLRGEPIWTAGVYEIVPGATVSGRGSPDRAVRFEVAVPVPGRAPIAYRATAQTDASGSYEVRLPYPSEAGYRVRSGSSESSLRITEADVREGRTVSGPHFE